MTQYYFSSYRPITERPDIIGQSSLTSIGFYDLQNEIIHKEHEVEDFKIIEYLLLEYKNVV